MVAVGLDMVDMEVVADTVGVVWVVVGMVVSKQAVWIVAAVAVSNNCHYRSVLEFI